MVASLVSASIRDCREAMVASLAAPLFISRQSIGDTGGFSRTYRSMIERTAHLAETSQSIVRPDMAKSVAAGESVAQVQLKRWALIPSEEPIAQAAAELSI